MASTGASTKDPAATLLLPYFGRKCSIGWNGYNDSSIASGLVVVGFQNCSLLRIDFSLMIDLLVNFVHDTTGHPILKRKIVPWRLVRP